MEKGEIEEYLYQHLDKSGKQMLKNIFTQLLTKYPEVRSKKPTFKQKTVNIY
jgi:23S rRNA maturation-related 3'-5' exoribonuclease YhaM